MSPITLTFTMDEHLEGDVGVSDSSRFNLVNRT